jgi:hypothetical protein
MMAMATLLFQTSFSDVASDGLAAPAAAAATEVEDTVAVADGPAPPAAGRAGLVELLVQRRDHAAEAAHRLGGDGGGGRGGEHSSTLGTRAQTLQDLSLDRKHDCALAIAMLH